MTSLEHFPQEYRFPVGSGHIIIRGGSNRPKGQLLRPKKTQREQGDESRVDPPDAHPVQQTPVDQGKKQRHRSKSARPRPGEASTSQTPANMSNPWNDPNLSMGIRREVNLGSWASPGPKGRGIHK